jgi:hypothetical protein
VGDQRSCLSTKAELLQVIRLVEEKKLSPGFKNASFEKANDAPARAAAGRYRWKTCLDFFDFLSQALKDPLKILFPKERSDSMLSAMSHSHDLQWRFRDLLVDPGSRRRSDPLWETGRRLQIHPR